MNIVILDLFYQKTKGTKMELKLEYQKPAEGIMMTNRFGKSMFYHIRCECGNPDDSHEVVIEADESTDSINVEIYTILHSKFWELSRWKQIWSILTKGNIEIQSTLVMSEQSALNYAETLKNAIHDLQIFKK
jgi:hypothetical protein